MARLKMAMTLLVLATGNANAQGTAPLAHVTPLIAKNLVDYPGKEGTMILVEYPPGGADPVHRHDAHGFIYVLEGSIVMEVKGGKPVTLTPGQVFYEGPNDIHTIGRNNSLTAPAKFVVFLLKKTDAPIFIPLPASNP